ncbi:MarR family transcriptional regulator [bacterium]|nr:MarR family transcriptional regulator [bacterium]
MPRPDPAPVLPPPLEAHICRTIYATNLAIQRVHKVVLDELGITYLQYLVLNLLWDRDNQSVSELSGQLELEPSTLTPLLKRLEVAGINVVGVTDHGFVHSIYFFDPSGHRIELACPDPTEDAQLKKLDAVKWDMLTEWSRTRRAPRHAAWMHEAGVQGLTLLAAA